MPACALHINAVRLLNVLRMALLMLACALLVLPAAAAAGVPVSANRLQRVAPGVYVLAGAAEAPNAANQGRVGNLGVLVGPRGVLVIDTGSSRARAEELLAAVRRITPLPVVAAVISHPAQEFLFGNAAFTDRHIPVYSAAATPRLMAQRCEHCLSTLTGLLGAARMQGTRLDLPQPLPPLPVAGDWSPGGRSVQIIEGPQGSVPGNLMIRDRRTGVVFSGALLSVGRVPAVQDTRPLAWRSALSALAQPSVAVVVPAYGAVVWRHPAAGQADLAGALDALGDYLQQLDEITDRAYQAGTPLADLAAVTALPAYADWAEYQPNHSLNVFYRYLQHEADDLAAH